jgi:hypothetical protein
MLLPCGWHDLLAPVNAHHIAGWRVLAHVCGHAAAHVEPAAQLGGVLPHQLREVACRKGKG